MDEKNADLIERVNDLDTSGLRIKSNVKTYINSEIFKQLGEKVDAVGKPLFNSTEINNDNILCTEAKLDEMNKKFEELQKQNQTTVELLGKLEDITVNKLQEFNLHVREELDEIQGRSRQNKSEVKSTPKREDLMDERKIVNLIQQEVNKTKSMDALNNI